MLTSSVNATRLQANHSGGALLLLSNSQTSLSLGKETSHFPTWPLLHQQASVWAVPVPGDRYFLQNEKSFLKMCSLKCPLTINNTIQCSITAPGPTLSFHTHCADSSELRACTSQVSFRLSLQPATLLWTTPSHFLKCIFLQNGFPSTYVSLFSTLNGRRNIKLKKINGTTGSPRRRLPADRTLKNFWKVNRNKSHWEWKPKPRICSVIDEGMITKKKKKK